MKRKLILIVLLLVLALPAAAALAAGGYDLAWWTVDGGGETSSGTGYSLSGTIGQADAGAMTGGNYSLAGGFWSGGAANPFIYLPLIQR